MNNQIDSMTYRREKQRMSQIDEQISRPVRPLSRLRGEFGTRQTASAIDQQMRLRRWERQKQSHNFSFHFVRTEKESFETTSDRI